MSDQAWMKEVSDSLKQLTNTQLRKEDVARQVTTAVNAAIDSKVTKRFDKINARQDKTEERLGSYRKKERNPLVLVCTGLCQNTL